MQESEGVETRPGKAHKRVYLQRESNLRGGLRANAPSDCRFKPLSHWRHPIGMDCKSTAYRGSVVGDEDSHGGRWQVRQVRKVFEHSRVKLHHLPSQICDSHPGCVVWHASAALDNCKTSISRRKCQPNDDTTMPCAGWRLNIFLDKCSSHSNSWHTTRALTHS
jgi:hypothetical protein